MTDDWKGEHLIHTKPAPEDRATEGRRVVSVTWHRKRRKAGEPTPAAANHSRFINRIFGDLTRKDT